MLTKFYMGSGRACRVTFEINEADGATSAALCGEFNNWDPSAYPMERRPDGSFFITVTLPAGNSYRFKYLLDAQRWENDWTADGAVANGFGSQDSLVVV